MDKPLTKLSQLVTASLKVFYLEGSGSTNNSKPSAGVLFLSLPKTRAAADFTVIEKAETKYY